MTSIKKPSLPIYKKRKKDSLIEVTPILSGSKG